MTNREMMVIALNNGFDDPGFTESCIRDYINCPYYNTEGHPRDSEDWDYPDDCTDCKYEWLEKEADHGKPE